MLTRSVGGVASLCLFATAAAAQVGGVVPRWDVRQNAEALAAHAKRVQPVFEQLKPEEWVRQGASESYVAQWKSTRVQLQALVDSAGKLAADPEKLTTALEVFFRLESLEAMLRSLSAGARRHQNAALADLLESLFTEGASSREKLREYILELAADQEQALKVMDQEAQRCRALLVRQPPSKNAGQKEERR